MEGSYLWDLGNALADMRLLIEGAVELYETDAMPLNRIAIEQKQLTAANALDTIGTALYDLRTHIRRQQQEHFQEVIRQVEGVEKTTV